MILRKIWRKIGPNPLDQILKKASKRGCKTILIPWNRGLGDIALGLYGIIHRIHHFIPDAKITFLTRPDLKDGFELLPNIQVLTAPEWVRGKPISLPPLSFDLVLENADPTYWVAWQRGHLIPKMTWNPAWDSLCERFNLPPNCIAAHVHSETNYYHERNWPRWKELFSQIQEPIVLFGLKKDSSFPNTIDLRGETTLFEILSIIKNKCRCLIAPDSGILGLTYFLNVPFKLHLISLWADPNHGILKQNVASPNPLLAHTPLISPNRKNAALIPVSHVQEALYPHPSFRSLGEKLLKQGKVASLILAGGQASRLGTSVPKALFPILPNKTLLQILCEKAPLSLPIALMTSPENFPAIQNYLQSHNNFDRNIHLFTQDCVPLLDLDGNPLDILAPDGNGHALKKLIASNPPWSTIEYVNILPIDNPLADPFDPILVGYHAHHQNDATLKSILRSSPTEKVGALISRDNHITVQEYSELPDHFDAPLAHIGLFCLSYPFIQRVAPLNLPWHTAQKTYQDRPVLKREHFLFDILPYSSKTSVLVYPREETYAPLKNSTGPHSPATVQQALADFARKDHTTA